LYRSIVSGNFELPYAMVSDSSVCEKNNGKFAKALLPLNYFY
jgi:hypothetical protein